MPASVTLVFDPATNCTTVVEDGQPDRIFHEPNGLTDLCAAGRLYTLCGTAVTIRVRRVPDRVQRMTR